MRIRVHLMAVCSVLLLSLASAWAAQPGGVPVIVQGKDAMMANSPFSAYTAGVATYLLFSIFLVLTLLVGGFLVVNISLMSKRPIDKGLGGHEPSDVGFLKGERSIAVNVRRMLPPEEDEDQPSFEVPAPELDPKTTLHEEDMTPDAGLKKAG
jgi:hypothetical protein